MNNMEEQNQAIIKIQNEVAQNKTNEALCNISEMLIDLMQLHPEFASKILGNGKTIAGALVEMRRTAEKSRNKSNCVCINPADAADIIFKYYGLAVDAKQILVELYMHGQQTSGHKAMTAATVNVAIEDLIK